MMEFTNDPSDIVTCHLIGGPLHGEYEARRDVAMSGDFNSYAPASSDNRRRRAWYRRDPDDPLVLRFVGWLPAHDDVAAG